MILWNSDCLVSLGDLSANASPSTSEKGHTSQFSCLMWNLKQIWSSLENSPCLAIPPDEPVVMVGTGCQSRFALTGKVVAVCFAYLEQVSSFLHPLEFTVNTAQGNAQGKELLGAFENKYATFYTSSFFNLVVTQYIRSCTDFMGLLGSQPVGNGVRINNARSKGL